MGFRSFSGRGMRWRHTRFKGPYIERQSIILLFLLLWRVQIFPGGLLPFPSVVRPFMELPSMSLEKNANKTPIRPDFGTRQDSGVKSQVTHKIATVASALFHTLYSISPACCISTTTEMHHISLSAHVIRPSWPRTDHTSGSARFVIPNRIVIRASPVLYWHIWP